MELKEIIKEYQEKTGFNDSEIARSLNITRSTVTRWRKGEIKRLSQETSDRLSELLGYNVEASLKGYDTTIFLPVLGYVKAGYDLFAQENYLGKEEVSLSERKDADFYLKVTGDSMNGVGILDGSLLLIRKCNQVDSGTISVVLVGDEVTVKKVIYKENMMILEAANPEVETHYYSPKDIKALPVQIIGKVISCKTYF